MSDIEIDIVVEGQTEQTFVREVLAPYMADKGIYLHPALIGTPGHKGGNICFDRAMRDIGNFLKQRNNTYIATMFDYYGIDSNWPGKAEINQCIKTGAALSALQKAEILEKATSEKVIQTFPASDSKNRFIPYIAMHEFEALLFSDVNILAERLEINVLKIKEIIEKYNNPEEINDNPDQTPSHRIQLLKREYRKNVMGKVISEAIGIQTIREKCLHFNNWLIKLDQLKS